LRWRLWFRDTDLGLVEMVPDWLDQAASEGPQMTSTISRRTTKEAARLQHERIAGGGDVQAES
jgi:hypothetical protein